MKPFALAVALAAMLALPSHAAALIQIDQGIAGARIGNSQAEVRAALGTPDLVRTGTNEFGPWRQYFYAGGIRVFFQGDGDVTSATTLGRGDRTARGIGVGSTERALKAKHRGLTCQTFEDGFRDCSTGSGEPGQRVTRFVITKGRVSRVIVGLVID